MEQVGDKVLDLTGDSPHVTKFPTKALFIGKKRELVASPESTNLEFGKAFENVATKNAGIVKAHSAEQNIVTESIEKK